MSTKTKQVLSLQDQTLEAKFALWVHFPVVHTKYTLSSSKPKSYVLHSLLQLQNVADPSLPTKIMWQELHTKEKKTIGTNKQRFDQIVGTIQVGHLFVSTKKIPLIIVGIQILGWLKLSLNLVFSKLGRFSLCFCSHPAYIWSKFQTAHMHFSTAAKKSFIQETLVFWVLLSIFQLKWDKKSAGKRLNMKIEL